MSNNMCSIENGSGSHSIPSVTSSFVSSSLSKPYGGHHLFPNLVPLPDTAFPFPPHPSLFLSSLLPQPRVSSPWFGHPPLATPLSLTTNDLKDSSHKSDSLVTHQKGRRNSSPERDSSPDTRKLNTAETNFSMNDSHRLSASNLRQHSDNLSWLADVAISSRASGQMNADSSGQHPSSPSMEHSSPIAAQRSGSLFNPSTLPNDSPRIYSPRFQTNNSLPMFHFQPPVTVSQPAAHAPPPPPPAHYPFISPYYHQQYSPTAQSSISPFLVPNTASVPTTRAVSYQNSIDSFNHQALLNVTVGSIQSHPILSNNCSQSPSVRSSDSPPVSGPYSSSSVSSASPEHTKSLGRSLKDSHSPNEEKRGSDKAQSNAVSCGMKRKSPNGLELNNMYKVPTGKEGSLKHRILKPPNINIINSNEYNMEAAPLSAPPIPGVRRDEFLSKISSFSATHIGPQTDAHALSESISSHNGIFNHHQRRKSVPHVIRNNSQSLLIGKHSLLHESHTATTPNENSAPLEAQSHLKYPIYFHKGSIIQLGNGKVKPVEEMSTQDFMDSASQSPDLCADCSEVIKIEDKLKSRSVLLSFSVGSSKVTVTVEAPVEHPFFVFHKGWSSYTPERSLQRYGLKCRKLVVGDFCVSLTPKPALTRTDTNKIDNNDVTHRKAHSHSILINQNEILNKNHEQFKISDMLFNNNNNNNNANNNDNNNANNANKNANDNKDHNSKERDSIKELEKKMEIPNVPIMPLKRNRRHSAPDMS